MQIVPIQPIPSQTLNVVLAGQNCQIALDQKNPCMFFSLNSNGADIAIGVQCRNAIPLNPCIYLGFVGNLVLFDTQGSDDPVYSGLGTRWQLVYLTEDEYAQLSE